MRRYILTITLLDVITTDDDLIDIHEDKRKCSFSQENSGASLFTNYSQSSCLFQGQLQKMLKDRNKPYCLPWDVPHPKDNTTICSGSANYLKNFQLYKKEFRVVPTDTSLDTLPKQHTIKGGMHPVVSPGSA